MTKIITESTPVVMLTVGQLRDFLAIPNEQKKAISANNEKRYVYGLAGIRQLFNVSHATAYRYKETIIKDAVSQQGRKIVVDADKALELFNSKYEG